ncbi:hypothetical protein JMF89_17290 [Clostridiaceae bacterium UIB06]|nr:hypothetical protein [Clostridiaceae bacterium UIB06]
MYPTKVSLKDFLGGTEIRFESIHKPIYHKCLFKINGRKHRAEICFENGIILVDGQVVRRCSVC